MEHKIGGRGGLGAMEMFLFLLPPVIAALLFFPALNYGFINYDDQFFVAENAMVQKGFTLEGVKWAWTQFYGLYEPFTWLSLMANVSLFGPGAEGFRVVNLLLHELNTVAIMLLCFRLFGSLRGALTLGLIFAIHPLQVEAVVWVSERKGLLSALFGLACAHSHLSFVLTRKRAWFWLGFALFLFSLLSKPNLVLLPVAMAVIHLICYKLNPASENPGQELTPMPAQAPFPWLLYGLYLLPMMGSLALTLYTERNASVVPDADSGWLSVDTMVVRCISFYGEAISKIVLPANLSIYYPRGSDFPWFHFVVGLGFILILAKLASRGGSKFAVCAGAAFVILLLPVSGIVPIATQRFADRYLYLPILAGAIAVFGLLSPLLRLPKVALASGVIWGIVLIGFGSSQVRTWASSEHLFSQSLEVNGPSNLAHLNLGSALYHKDPRAALTHFFESLRCSPNDRDSIYNVGITLGKLSHERMFSINEWKEFRRDDAADLLLLAKVLLQHPMPRCRDEKLAAALLEKAVSLPSSSGLEAQRKLCEACLDLNQTNRAYELAQRGVRLADATGKTALLSDFLALQRRCQNGETRDKERN